MTQAEAVGIAQTVAEQQRWPWTEPVLARRYRTFVFLGKRVWHVMTNAENRGGNVNVHIDDATGRVIRKGFAPH